MKPVRLKTGFTDFTETDDYISIEHRGNIGNGIDSVNKNLKILKLPPISHFKMKYRKYEEKGSPDYMYSIVFTKKH